MVVDHDEFEDFLAQMGMRKERREASEPPEQEPVIRQPRRRRHASDLGERLDNFQQQSIADDSAMPKSKSEPSSPRVSENGSLALENPSCALMGSVDGHHPVLPRRNMQ